MSYGYSFKFKLRLTAVVCMLSLLALIIPESAKAQTSFLCDLEGQGVNCTPQPLSQTFYIPISTTPPCSVQVDVYGKYCDDAFEVLDLAIKSYSVLPPGCGTHADVHNYVVANYSLVLQTIYEEVAKFVFNAAHPTGYNCPDSYTLVSAVMGSCRRPVLTWYRVDLPPVVVSYDLSLPWSWYDATKPSDGFNPTISMVSCNNVCCYSTVSLCRQNGVLIVTQSEYQMEEECTDPNSDPNCRPFICEEN